MDNACIGEGDEHLDSVSDSKCIPWRRSFMPKKVRPNSFTFSSNARHCARESGSVMKSLTEAKPLRGAVLLDGVSHFAATIKRGWKLTGCCGRLLPRYSLVVELGALLHGCCTEVSRRRGRVGGYLQSFESLWACNFVHEMSVSQ